MKERFPEPSFNQETPTPEEIEAITEHQENEDRNIGFQFDVMVHGRSEATRLGAVETRREIEEDLTDNPEASQLYYLKEKIVDPLMDYEPFRRDRIFQDRLRETFDRRYENFLFPGYVRYDFRRHESKIANPGGISFGLQKMALEKAGVAKDESQIRFYEAGRENELPKNLLKKSLIVSNGPNGQLESPTMAVFDTLRRMGRYNRLSAEGKRDLLPPFTFTEIVERGEWLEGAKRNFYDENDITLFKINRLLDTETLTAMLKEMTADVKFDPRDFAGSKKEMREQLFIRAAAKLSPEMIAKYRMDEKDARGKSIIDKQKESITKSREFLEKGTSVANKSNLGRIIYVRSDENGKADKLVGGLPAIASEAPKDKKGNPVWRQPNGYFEFLTTHFLGLVKKEKMNGLADALEKETTKSGLNIQVTPIEDWVKIFIPFNGEIPQSVVAAFEKNAFETKPPAATEKPPVRPTSKKKVSLKTKTRA